MTASVIDLFCGIGGLSYGLLNSGIPVVAGIDTDETCKYAFEKNLKADFLSKDIAEVKGIDLIQRYWSNSNVIKVLVGCAPCQPFSTHTNKIRNKQSTSKWNLLNEFKRLICETQPDIVSMENVPNLKNQEIFKEFIKFLEQEAYFISYSNVYCPDYGIPQKRRRLVLLASKLGVIQIIPKTHSRGTYITLKEAIGNLPPIEAGKVCETDPLHRSISLSKTNLLRIKMSKPNGTWLDWDTSLQLECHKKKSGQSYKSVYGRMSWDEPSSTITTQFFNYGTGRFGHPTQDRALTLREGAILQSFPKEFAFYENEKDIYIRRLGMHIGNAVPVRLGFIIGKSIQAHLERYHGRKP